MLKRLTVNHFKSLESVEIDLSSINIFVGNNASGKTNIVDAIRLIRDAMQNGLDRAIGDRHGIESIRQWSPTRPFRLSMSLLFEEDDLVAKYHFGIDSGRGEVRVVHEDAEVYEREEIFIADEEERDNAEPGPGEHIYHSKKRSFGTQKVE